MKRVNGFRLTGQAPELYDISSDQNVSATGKGSTVLSSKSGADPARFGALIKYFTTDRCAGMKVKMTAFVKTEHADRCCLFMRVDSKVSKETLALDNMNHRPIIGTHDFKKYELVLDVDKDAMFIACGLYLLGNGKAWLDGLDLKVVDQKVATTETEVAPIDWHLVGEHPELYERGDDSSDGGHYIRSDKSKEENSGSLIKYLTIIPHKGKSVKLSADVKAVGVDRGAGLWMNIVDKEGNSVAFENMESQLIKGNTDWTHEEIVLPVPNNAHQAAYGIHLNGPGKFLVRNEKVEVVQAKG